MDGVLYDSLPQYVEAWTAACSMVGVSVTRTDVYRHEGRASRETIHYLARAAGINPLSAEQSESVLEAKRRTLAALGPAPLQQGAVALIQALAGTGLPLWVVTGSTRAGTRDRLLADFAPYLVDQRIVTGNEVERGKPDPEPYLLAAERARCHPADMLVIENAPLGVEAAARAGAYCIAVNTGILPTRELIAAGAHMALDDCEQLRVRVLQLLSVRSEATC